MHEITSWCITDSKEFFYFYSNLLNQSYKGFFGSEKNNKTGWPIKNFHPAGSHDKNPSNFKSTFIYYCIGLSFEVYNSSLGQLAKKW